VTPSAGVEFAWRPSARLAGSGRAEAQGFFRFFFSLPSLRSGQGSVVGQIPGKGREEEDQQRANCAQPFFKFFYWGTSSTNFRPSMRNFLFDPRNGFFRFIGSTDTWGLDVDDFFCRPRTQVRRAGKAGSGRGQIEGKQFLAGDPPFSPFFLGPRSVEGGKRRKQQFILPRTGAPYLMRLSRSSCTLDSEGAAEGADTAFTRLREFVVKGFGCVLLRSLHS